MILVAVVKGFKELFHVLFAFLIGVRLVQEHHGLDKYF